MVLLNKMIDKFNQSMLENGKLTDKRSEDILIDNKIDNIINTKNGDVPPADGGRGSGKDGKGSSCNNPNHAGLEKEINSLQLMAGRVGTPEEIQQKIKEHLDKTKKEWGEYLKLEEKEKKEKKNLFLFLAWEKYPERQKRAGEILSLINSNSDTTLEGYKKLVDDWNRGKKEIDLENEAGGALFTLKGYLKSWENPPAPALTPEEQKKLDNYDSLEKENKRLKNRELNENERKIIIVFRRANLSLTNQMSPLGSRLQSAKSSLESLEKNDLNIDANPNLSSQGISFPQTLANLLKQFAWICEFYLKMEKKLNGEVEKLEKRISELEK